MRVTVKIRVVGHVQGVSFRTTLQKKAQDNRVDGWVKNAKDGSVEALLQGQKDSVQRVVEWARTGPPRARVSSVIETKVSGSPPLDGFNVVA